MDRSVEDEDFTVAEEWSGATPSHSFLSSVYVAQERIAAHSLSAELPWTSHQYYNARLPRESGVKRRGVQSERWIQERMG